VLVESSLPLRVVDTAPHPSHPVHRQASIFCWSGCHPAGRVDLSYAVKAQRRGQLKNCCCAYCSRWRGQEVLRSVKRRLTLNIVAPKSSSVSHCDWVPKNRRLSEPAYRRRFRRTHRRRSLPLLRRARLPSSQMGNAKKRDLQRKLIGLFGVEYTYFTNGDRGRGQRFNVIPCRPTYRRRGRQWLDLAAGAMQCRGDKVTRARRKRRGRRSRWRHIAAVNRIKAYLSQLRSIV